VRDDAARADDGTLADGHAAQDGGIAADGRAALDQGGDALPIGFGLQAAAVCRGTRVSVVDEHDAMPDEDLVFDGHPFADEGVARDLHPAADADTFLDLHEGADLALVADLTAIQVDESIDPHILAQFHVGCDAHKIPCFHLPPPGFRH